MSGIADWYADGGNQSNHGRGEFCGGHGGGSGKSCGSEGLRGKSGGGNGSGLEHGPNGACDCQGKNRAGCGSQEDGIDQVLGAAAEEFASSSEAFFDGVFIESKSLRDRADGLLFPVE